MAKEQGRGKGPGSLIGCRTTGFKSIVGRRINKPEKKKNKRGERVARDNFPELARGLWEGSKGVGQAYNSWEGRGEKSMKKKGATMTSRPLLSFVTQTAAKTEKKKGPETTRDCGEEKKHFYWAEEKDPRKKKNVGVLRR